MTIHQSWSGSSMTIDRVVPGKASPVRLATPYLEVETQPTPSAERAIPVGASAGQPGRDEEAQGRRSTSHRVARGRGTR